MQSLITVYAHPTLGPVVSGRELHPLLSRSRSLRDLFTIWFRSQEARFGLVQGKDFILLNRTRDVDESESFPRGRLVCVLTLATVRRICCAARGERGSALLALIQAHEAGKATNPIAPIARHLVGDLIQGKYH